MSVLPFPEYKFRAVQDISADFLARKSIEFLMLDLDNTLAPYKQALPLSAVTDWAAAVRASGVKLCIVSNSRKEKRVRIFAVMLESPYVTRAGKPSPSKLLEVMRAGNVSPDKAALVGDQIYTDVLSARLAGITPILISPMDLRNPLLAIRYALEAPFRIRGRAE
ncbi:MAG: YqeG family HAD IIIA-type phosphatase [Oscillospiraceae bacterium]|jgi:HAD superfamily phosphatase (TIGR01668 family)|nr:YqeG family HAD IIIA-type phosphatase [Oscillospiraceae bacterium]